MRNTPWFEIRKLHDSSHIEWELSSVCTNTWEIFARLVKQDWVSKYIVYESFSRIEDNRSTRSLSLLKDTPDSIVFGIIAYLMHDGA